MPKVTPVAFSADDIWGAAAYATMLNGGYLKSPKHDYDKDKCYVVVKEANRDVAKKALADGVVNEEHRILGRKAQQFLSGRLAMKALTKRLNDFEASLAGTIALTEFIVPEDRSKIGLVNSQIVSYQRQLNEELLTENAVWGYLSEVGMRLDTTVTMTSCFWIDNFAKFRYNAITNDGYKTSFYNSGKHDVGSTVEIRGTVKKHAENVTMLNRVKIKEIN